MRGDLKSVLEESSNWHQASIAEFHFREYSEKYNLQKFEDSRSFVVIFSKYSQLTLAIMLADGWQPCCSDLCVKFSFNFVRCHRKNSTHCFPYKHD